MANIGPAMSFYFGFGFLAMTEGVGSPLTILLAGIAILILGNTLSEFTKVTPSTGGFITFVGKTFGGRTAVTTAIITGFGYMIAMASVIAVSGGFLQIILQNYNIKGLQNVPWIIWTLIFLAFAAFMMFRGIKISTKLAGFFFAFEMAVMFVIAIATLIKFHGSINFKPFEPKNITGGLGGLAAGFPLAVYLFIGWENSAALAEETENPRKNVPKAVFTSVGIMIVSYLLFAFSNVVGYQDNVTKLSAQPIPFLGIAHEVAGWVAFFGFLAGMTSTVGCLIAGTNSQARLVFNAAREGLLPSFIGKVNQARRTPLNALLFFLSVGTLSIAIWGFLHLVGHNASGGMSALNFFAESSTFGTILVLVVYTLGNLALPIYMRRHHASDFKIIRHLILPVLGIVTVAIPLYYLAKPGQATPYDWFPWAALGIIVAAALVSIVLVQRDPKIGERVGSIVADH